VACHRAGLRYLGVEIDPEHYATAKARLQRETAQGLLDFGTANKVIAENGK
jgi:DNA modification methylase